MTTLLNDVVNLFYPEQCLLCKRQLTDNEENLCIACQCDLPRTNWNTFSANPARALFEGYPQVGEVSSFLYFEKEGKTQHLIHSLKYFGNRRLAEHLGRLAATELKESGIYASIDAVIPIPLHPRKQRKRGYNQSECIARGIAAVYRCAVDTASVRRTTYTLTQTRKSTYERHVNVENIFAVTKPEALYGKHILLVDDVITTGATTSACIEALREVPNLKISVFSLSIARS